MSREFVTDLSTPIINVGNEKAIERRGTRKRSKIEEVRSGNEESAREKQRSYRARAHE